MTKTTRSLIGIFVVLCLIFTTTDACFAARPGSGASRANPKYAAIIIDAQTGRVLYEQNADRVLFPASLTKMMTLFLAFEAIENGKLGMDQYLKVSANSIRQPPSKLGIRVGEPITMRQAIQALVTRSANDVAVAMAETVGGSEKNFTRMMTERAHSLGMSHSNFVNASGLPSPYQRSSARDMAILGRALMQYFPQHYAMFKTLRFTYKGQTIETHNNLMRRFPGMDGLKTGYTYASGFNLAASAVKNNRRVIVVVFGGRTAVSRDNHVAELLNRGFAMLERDKTSVQIAAAQPVPIVASTSATLAAKAPPTMQVTTVKDVLAKTMPSGNAVHYADVGKHSVGWTPDGGHVQTLSAPATTPIAEAINQQTPSYIPATPSQPANWGIQVGAYGNPGTGQDALQIVKRQLGPLLNDAQPVVVPTQTANGVMYRARLVGLSADNAAKACARLTECLTFTVR